MSMSVDSVNDEDFECRVEAQFEVFRKRSKSTISLMELCL